MSYDKRSFAFGLFIAVSSALFNWVFGLLKDVIVNKDIDLMRADAIIVFLIVPVFIVLFVYLFINENKMDSS